MWRCRYLWLDERKKRIKKLGLLIVFLLIMAVDHSWAAGVKLSWNPVQDSDLAEYGVYAGDTGGPYSLISRVISSEAGQPIPTEYVFNVPEGTDQSWYFVVDAADESGNRSGYSNEVASDKIDLLPPVPPGGLRVIRLAPSGEGAVIILPPQ